MPNWDTDEQTPDIMIAVLNIAYTVVSPKRFTVHVPVPLHPPPLQPPKVELETEVAVSVKEVPEFAVSEQSEPQEIPVPVIMPLPAPLFATVNV